MKSLEIQLKKRLLIVEGPNYSDYIIERKDGRIYLTVGSDTAELNCPPDSDFKLICRGSDLTEEIAAGMIHSWFNEMTDELFCRDYKSKIIDNLDADCAMSSFISAIEAQGWYWGNNPLAPYEFAEKRHIVSGAWQEAESRTFHPERTIIFEIVE